jgi:hypothetical protein
MQFLVLGHWTHGEHHQQRLSACLEEEVRYAWASYMDGHLRHFWYRADGEAQALIVEGSSREEVETLLTATPFERDGVATWEVIELKPFAPWSVLFRPAPETAA